MQQDNPSPQQEWISDVILPQLFLQDLEELDPDFIMAKQVEQLEKEKKELQERLKNQEKKVINLSDAGVKTSCGSCFDISLCLHRLITLRERNASKRFLR